MHSAERSGLCSSFELLEASRKLKERGLYGIGIGFRGLLGNLEANVWILIRRFVVKIEKGGFRSGAKQLGRGRKARMVSMKTSEGPATTEKECSRDRKSVV